ncbi:MAG: glutathione S-transferase family protein [Phyllobacterium sp.]
MDVRLYGTPESVYVRIVQLVLRAKKVGFVLVRADPFEEGGLPSGYEDLHPFGRIPALEIDGIRLYETDAIVHFIDAMSGNAMLVPNQAADSACMRQIMRIVDNYAYRPLVWGLYVPVYWRDGLAPESAAIEASRHVLGVLEGFVATAPLADHAHPTLASFYLAGVLAAADSVEPGSSLIDERPRLREWWNGLRTTSLMADTRSEHTKF